MDERALDFLVLGPAGSPDATLPIAGSRAGALGVVNLEFCTDRHASAEAVAQLTRHARGRTGALVDARTDMLEPVLGAGLDVVVLSHGAGERLTAQVAAIHGRGHAGMMAGRRCLRCGTSTAAGWGGGGFGR